MLVREDGSTWQEYIHSSGVDFAAVVALDDGSFLMVGEDGVFRYPEANEEKGDD